MRLISWNIQWCRGVDGRVDPARIGRVAKALADADVICFQEVARNYPTLAGSKGEDQFALLSAAFPGYAAIEGIAVDVLDDAACDGRRQFGNLLLSRLPVRQAFCHLLPWPADPRHADMQRMAIETVLESRLGPLRVTTTHLAYYAKSQRMAQVEALRSLHVQARAHVDPPAHADTSRGPFHWLGKPAAGIVTGDFNFRPDSEEFARMLQPFPDATPLFLDAWQTTHPGRAHAATVGVHDREQWQEPFCCDFAFVSSDLVPRLAAFEVDQETDASDHQPLLLTLE